MPCRYHAANKRRPGARRARVFNRMGRGWGLGGTPPGVTDACLTPLRTTTQRPLSISRSGAICADAGFEAVRSGSATSASARSRSSTTTTPSRRCISRELIERRPKNLWRYRELLPIDGEPRTGLHSGLHAAGARRPPGRAPWRPRALRQGRLGQPSDLLVQGSRRLGRRDARRRARLHGVRLRVDRQPRQQRRVARGAARPRLLRLHSRRPRARQGRRRRGLRAAHHRRRAATTTT